MMVDDVPVAHEKVGHDIDILPETITVRKVEAESKATGEAREDDRDDDEMDEDTLGTVAPLTPCKVTTMTCPAIGCMTPKKGKPRRFTSLAAFVKHMVDFHAEDYDIKLQISKKGFEKELAGSVSSLDCYSTLSTGVPLNKDDGVTYLLRELEMKEERLKQTELAREAINNALIMIQYFITNTPEIEKVLQGIGHSC
jgi:hypothetical protein